MYVARERTDALHDKAVQVDIRFPFGRNENLLAQRRADMAVVKVPSPKFWCSEGQTEEPKPLQHNTAEHFAL